MKTLIDILNLSAEHLRKKDVDEPRLSAELIISHSLGIKRLDIYLQFDRVLNEDQLVKIREMLSRRSAHEPLQYIFGETEFYGLRFKTVSGVLIPRPDTEILVGKITENIGDKKINILEIGTGSGCIAVSVAHSCGNAKIKATDISETALKSALENAEKNNVIENIEFIKHDIFTDKINRKFDLIVSNPPYIRKEIISTLNRQVREYEPINALSDNNDGLTFYRRINELLPEILNKRGLLFLEIGYDQKEEVTRIYEKSLENISITRDLGGNPRVFSGTFIG
ncbi:MAG TPA: peptide chain release factor N(5)-glutamine methyltransferase [Clostridiales bacterium]|nr:peptide chain release factor N(5)-glutamine methyltransferase [Clostridiales bacterium]